MALLHVALATALLVGGAVAVVAAPMAPTVPPAVAVVPAVVPAVPSGSAPGAVADPPPGVGAPGTVTERMLAVAQAPAYVPPVTPAVLLAAFLAPPQRWSPGHRGVDLATAPGAVAVSPADGVVVFSGLVVDRPVVAVAHHDGLRSSLEPVVGEVAVGTPVAAGQRLGTIAHTATHCEPAHCLHWGVRRGETYLDPLGLLAGGGPTVLLPVPRSP